LYVALQNIKQPADMSKNHLNDKEGTQMIPWFIHLNKAMLLFLICCWTPHRRMITLIDVPHHQQSFEWCLIRPLKHPWGWLLLDSFFDYEQRSSAKMLLMIKILKVHKVCFKKLFDFESQNSFTSNCRPISELSGMYLSWWLFWPFNHKRHQ
jgi:hypothetical protein